MNCILLKGEQQKFCTAYEELMVLSLDELKRFCESPHYDLCPVYQRFHDEGVKASITEHQQYKNFVGA